MRPGAERAARAEARIAAIYAERDRVIEEGMRAFDREATRERLQRDAAHVWGEGGAAKENAPPKVFRLVGMSAESVRAVGDHVSADVTGVEERVALNRWQYRGSD